MDNIVELQHVARAGRLSSPASNTVSAEDADEERHAA